MGLRIYDVDDRVFNEYGAFGGMKFGRGTEVLGDKIYRLSITFSTTNPTCPYLCSNPGHRDGQPATNRLS
jgi:hypothetical protein